MIRSGGSLGREKGHAQYIPGTAVTLDLERSNLSKNDLNSNRLYINIPGTLIMGRRD